MTKSTKLYVISACVVLCLFVIAGLGYSTWMLHKKVAELDQSNTSTYGVMDPSLPPLTGNSGIWKNFGPMPDDFSQMQTWANEMMENMMSRTPGFNQPGFGALQQAPKIAFEESPSEYKATIEMLKGEEVELNTEISDGVLTVSGRVKRSGSDEGLGLFSQTQFSSKFSRIFVLDKPVDQAAMQVINENGKTIVRIPKIVS